MHELSIAHRLIEVVEDELAASGVSSAGPAPAVRQVVIRVGDLSGVVAEALRSALAVAKIGTFLDETIITIKSCPAAIWCENCKAEHILSSIQSRRCPVCGCLSSKLTSGRELELASIEVVSPSTLPDALGT